MEQVERVAVSLPKTLVMRVEGLRERMGFNRSKFYQMALKNYVGEFSVEEDDKLARLYQDVRKTDQKLLHHFRQHSYKHLPPYQK